MADVQIDVDELARKLADLLAKNVGTKNITFSTPEFTVDVAPISAGKITTHGTTADQICAKKEDAESPLPGGAPASQTAENLIRAQIERLDALSQKLKAGAYGTQPYRALEARIKIGDTIAALAAALK